MADIWRGKLARLRAVEPEDWQAHVAWDQDSAMSRDLDFVWPPISAARARAWAERMATRESENDELAFEIEALDDGGLVGHIATHNCDRRVGGFEYGVATLAERRRRGYAGEAILLVARYFFQELRYQKMNARIYSFNTASLALHEKLGFTREGTLRRMVYTGGHYHDIALFGMTDDEFAARYPELAAAW